jgi:two-component system LytT family sensor kinase
VASVGGEVALVAVLGLIVVVPLLALWRIRATRRSFGTAEQLATLRVLEEANEAAPPFRQGLAEGAQSKNLRHVAALLGVPAVCMLDHDRVLGIEGEIGVHADELSNLARPALESGRPVLTQLQPCPDGMCPLAVAVAVPLVAGDQVAGALVALAPTAGTGLIRTAEAVARWVATQVELADLDRSRARLAEAELRALRAQISPHFVYNALTTIASFVRTDPERARDLLLDFADFTRYSLRDQGLYSTLADELLAVDRYLGLERARFGDRLGVTLRIAPEVLSVAIPTFVIQPLVENAVHHGLLAGEGRVTIVAEDGGPECWLSVEDDGVGMDPEEATLRFAGPHDGIGLANVDERLRYCFGDSYGLVVETGVDAGTKVSLRVPKWAPGVRAS